jgi:hypothetical protein
MGSYLGRLYETWTYSGPLGYLLVIVWLLYPVAVATIFHPTDAVGFQAWLQGMDIPRYVSHQAVGVGLLEALIALVILFVFHLVIVTLIYRRTQIKVHFWPLALVLVGVVANGFWYLFTGHWDVAGALAGASPAFLAIGAHGVCERLGERFVFGPEPQMS